MTHEELFAKATRLQQEGNLSEAISLYEALLHQNPKEAEILHRLGLAHAQLGDMKKAIAFFEEAITLTPADPVLYNNLGNAYKKNQQVDKALASYQKAINLAPDYAQAQNNLAGIYARQGMYKEALQHYRLAVHAEPDFAAAHYNLGLLLMSNHQLDAAYTQFKNVLALNPINTEAAFYRGVLDLEANRLTDAEDAFQRVLALESNHVEALTNLGVVALKRNDGQVAIDYFTKALALDNNHIEARNNLAATFIHHDRFENALMHYDVLLKQEPLNSEYLYNSGVAQMALGHLNEAITHFEALLTQNPDHFATLNNLAAIYIRMEDRIKAKELLQRAIAANPLDKSSQHMLRALSGGAEEAQTCPEYAANLFNNYALYYDEHLQKYLHYAIPNQIVAVLDALSVEKVAHVLDLGCGTGLSGQALRDISQQLDGVDISSKMLEHARAKGIYDHLIEADALTFLKDTAEHYGLIVAADVLPYFGELNDLFEAVKARLNPPGYFIFTTEISTTTPWQLQPSARFAHNADYLQQLATKYGLEQCYQREVVARHQDGKELAVLLIALQSK
ncbi:MAG: tetratricopeptide repeat protein [Legionella sp.]|nr:tetratricopeptide repeat protein [Legionella sp.]